MTAIIKSGASGLAALRRDLAPVVHQESVVLVLDVSFSMENHMGSLRDAAAGFLAACSKSTHAGVVTFHQSANVISSLKDGLAAAKACLSRVREAGGTNILAGIKAGWAQLNTDRAKVNRIVLMTDAEDVSQGWDGDVTSVGTTDHIIQAVKLHASRAIIDCVGFRDGANSKLLAEIARLTGGVVKNAKTAPELVRAFRQLEGGIRGLLTST